MNLQECDKMTIDAPTLDTITGHTVMVKMRELIKQMTTFAKEVADLVNSIPTEVQDTYSREAIDGMVNDINDAIDDITGDITSLMQDKANASDVYTKTETDELLSDKVDTSDVYDKTETDTLLATKANVNNVYTKNEVYNTTEVYNMQEVNNLLNDKQDELTAGTGIAINNNVIGLTNPQAQIIDLNVSYVSHQGVNKAVLNNVVAGDIVTLNIKAFHGFYVTFIADSNTQTMFVGTFYDTDNIYWRMSMTVTPDNNTYRLSIYKSRVNEGSQVDILIDNNTVSGKIIRSVA